MQRMRTHEQLVSVLQAAGNMAVLEVEQRPIPQPAVAAATPDAGAATGDGVRASAAAATTAADMGMNGIGAHGQGA